MWRPFSRKTAVAVLGFIVLAAFAIAGFMSAAELHLPGRDHAGKSERTSITLMAPLLIGAAQDPDTPQFLKQWQEFDRELAKARELGVDAISTDVWWGVVEPDDGKFDWRYYDKLSDHIAKSGLKWVAILSLHACGGNVGDDVSVPLPTWIWMKLANKAGSHDPALVCYISEQGNSSKEYVSAWATDLALADYEQVFTEFQKHFANKAALLEEINISLGPSGELRYPSYNSHDKNSACPNRGALQCYSALSKRSFRRAILTKYGGIAAVSKAWCKRLPDSSAIAPPSCPNLFFARREYLNSLYGRDLFDWYQNSLLDHGRKVMQLAGKIFNTEGAPFKGIDIGAKIPGIHWRMGWLSHTGGSQLLVPGDRLAELNCGMIRSSGNDWSSEALGHGYRPILAMFKCLNSGKAKIDCRYVPSFTAIELADGCGNVEDQSLPHTLSSWVGAEAARQQLVLKGENALAQSLHKSDCWQRIRQQLIFPNEHKRSGYYQGVTLLRLSDVINDPHSCKQLAEIIVGAHTATNP